MLACLTGVFQHHGVTDPVRYNSYTLYVTARVSPASEATLFLRKSPRAVLERFVGPNTALDAPEWTQWTHSTLEFQQPKATFVSLFTKMATWDENVEMVRHSSLQSSNSRV